MLLPDVCLSVCLSVEYTCKSGLTREQRGLGRLKLPQRLPTSQDQKVKGQLAADVLNSKHAGTCATWRINANILSTCRGRKHIVSPLAQLVIIIIIIKLLVISGRTTALPNTAVFFHAVYYCHHVV